MISEQQERLIAETKRIEEFSLWNATTHFETAGWARILQVILGLLPILIGGFGGWQYLSDPSTATPKALMVGSLLSLTAGIIGSALAFLNLTKIQTDHFVAASRYKTLENGARRAYQLLAFSEDAPTFQARVMELGRQYDVLNEECPQSWNFALWFASRKIRKGIFESERKSQ